MIPTLILGMISYISTNIDDLFVITLLFSATKTLQHRRRICAGICLGTLVITAISVLAALGLKALPGEYVALLGAVPILLGIRAIVSAVRGKSDDSEEPAEAGVVLGVMLITIADGADNIGVYTPVFAGLEIWQIGVIVSVFAVMTFLLCTVGQKISDIPPLRSFLEKYSKFIVPAVYIALGIYVLIPFF